MNEGTAAITMLEESDQDPNGYLNSLYKLLPDVALVRYSGADPKMLDEVLQGPNAKEWQEALENEISQLKKLGTWKVKDLPQGQSPIPCSEVIKVKQGPKGEIQSY